MWLHFLRAAEFTPAQREKLLKSEIEKLKQIADALDDNEMKVQRALFSTVPSTLQGGDRPISTSPISQRACGCLVGDPNARIKPHRSETEVKRIANRSATCTASPSRPTSVRTARRLMMQSFSGRHRATRWPQLGRSVGYLVRSHTTHGVGRDLRLPRTIRRPDASEDSECPDAGISSIVQTRNVLGRTRARQRLHKGVHIRDFLVR